MDEVILFDKTLQQRLQDYEDVFSGYENLPVSAIQKEWGFYLEFAMDSSGWQAIWKIQRKTCEQFSIPFPSIVLVYVLHVDMEELSALVKVLAVQEDIHIPDKHKVPLIQLWPTKHQEKSIALNLHSTANSLDMLRFFYNNLFMPWDYEEDGDWKLKHLEPRLRLYYDMIFGIIPKNTADHLRSLMTEAKKLQVKQELLQSKIEEMEDPDEQLVDLNSNKHVQALTELHIRMMEIKGEYEILENPLLRSALIKKQAMNQKSHANTPRIWVIFDEGLATEGIELLSLTQQQYPNKILSFATELAPTLENGTPHDVFILKETTHWIAATGALEQGGTLKAVSDNRNTKLVTNNDDIMLDFNCDKVLLENLTINAETPQCAIIVRKGTVCLMNCTLIGDGKSSTHQGIIVLAGASLQLKNCEISHFSTAIVGNSGSEIHMENCDIHTCNFGVKVFDNCALRACNTTIWKCRDYGICVETEKSVNDEESKVGNFDTLNIIPSLQIESMKGLDNAKGDAVINHKWKVKPIEDFFENPDLDPTICFDSDDDEAMEEMQETPEGSAVPLSENIGDKPSSPVTV